MAVGTARRPLDTMPAAVTDRRMHFAELAADHEVIKYAKKRVRRIVEYRKMSAENVLEIMDNTPWAWQSTKKFQNLLIPPHSEKEIRGIYQCAYNGRSCLFGIAKEEVPITEDMREHGKWFAYTWSD